MDRTDSEFLRSIAYPSALHRFGTTMKAASFLGTSHQTVARRIDELEKALDIRLIDRTGHQWVLTELAVELVDESEPISEIVQRIRQKTRSHNHQMTSTVKLASVDFVFDFPNLAKSYADTP